MSRLTAKKIPKKTTKKKSKPKTPVVLTVYTCRWCGKEKREDKFFKCSIDNNALICQDCIKKKYKEVLERCFDKAKAILVCCHHLNVAFLYDIYKSLNIGEGIGIYIRQLNLTQNKNPENFEEGIINHFEFDMNVIKNEQLIDDTKQRLDDIIKRLEEVRNDL